MQHTFSIRGLSNQNPRAQGDTDSFLEYRGQGRYQISSARMCIGTPKKLGPKASRRDYGLSRSPTVSKASVFTRALKKVYLGPISS